IPRLRRPGDMDAGLTTEDEYIDKCRLRDDRKLGDVSSTYSRLTGGDWVLWGAGVVGALAPRVLLGRLWPAQQDTGRAPGLTAGGVRPGSRRGAAAAAPGGGGRRGRS